MSCLRRWSWAASGDCRGAGGAEASGQLVAQCLVFGPQAADLVAVRAELLTQRVGGVARSPVGRVPGRAAEASRSPVDLLAELGLAVKPGTGHARGLGDAAER